MSDLGFYDDDEDGDGVVLHSDGSITANRLTGNPIEADSVSEDTFVADSTTAGEVTAKPEWTLGSSKLGTDPRLPGVVNEGPEVDYVNRVLGVDAEKYTMETANALTEYLKGRELGAKRVNKAVYDQM